MLDALGPHRSVRAHLGAVSLPSQMEGAALLTARRQMGALETEVLMCLWAAEKPMSSADVRGALEKELAYTTVMTILTRLWQKGLAEREQQGRRFVYRPLLSEAELVARRMHCDLMRSSDHERALAKFVQGLSGPEVKMLRKLMEPRSSRSPRRS